MKFQIESIAQAAPGVNFFSLRPAGPFSYVPGQFVTILHHDHGRELRRSYSLFEYVGLPTIGVKRIDNGVVSRWLHDEAQAGDILECDGGAHGLFHLATPLTAAAIWLFAAGIGITPVYAVLQDALRSTLLEIVLIYSSQSRADCVLRTELEELERVYRGRLKIVWLFSDAKNLLRARFSKESFPVIRREALPHPPDAVTCFVCGPAKYMWLVRLLLESAGVPDAAIRQERFIAEKAQPSHQPPDKGLHTITIRLNDGTQQFRASFPDSILRAARKASIDLPYSCEAGQCGSCLAYCSSGKVWMSYNEVLTPNDLAAGRILTCTGYPVGGDVEIRLP